MKRCRLAPRVVLFEPGAGKPDLEEGELALPQLPSAAFGDGKHPTTRLCAGAVDLLCRQRRPRAVLDVGTGTGVLARIARARGVPFVAATDIDPRALAAARANRDLDDYPGELCIADRPPDSWGARFELVVANILEEPLHQLAPGLVAALAPAGALLLSGFTPLQAPALRVAYTELGLARPLQSTQDGWAALLFESA